MRQFAVLALLGLCAACGKKEEPAEPAILQAELEAIDLQTQKIAALADTFGAQQKQIAGQQETIRREAAQLAERAAVLSEAVSRLESATAQLAQSSDNIQKDLHVLRQQVGGISGGAVVDRPAPAKRGGFFPQVVRYALAILIVIGVVALVVRLKGRDDEAGEDGARLGGAKPDAGPPVETSTPYGPIRLYGAAKAGLDPGPPSTPPGSSSTDVPPDKVDEKPSGEAPKNNPDH